MVASVGSDPLEVIAFFLPQFHPIEENDRWWGPGFTEWTNVAKARPQFRGHYQPHLPADLGFYDLRLPEVRQQQADLAAAAGITGFAYYHYWFNGRRLLERPVDDVVASGEPDFPFFLVWANENWTRTWDGGDQQVLVEQKYSPEDDLAHIQSLRTTLCDPRYMTRDGRPMLAIYRSGRLPDSRATTELWRAEVRSWGLPDLYLLRIESFEDEYGDPRPLGFDAAVQFQPSWENVPPLPMRSRARRRLRRLGDRYSHAIIPYPEFAAAAMQLPLPTFPKWPGVTPGFDNSARRRARATILTDASPAVYERWLRWACDRSRQLARRAADGSPGLVFINAWNEWAEGNHLEPDQRHGRAYLDATRSAVLAPQAAGSDQEGKDSDANPPAGAGS